MWRHIALGMRTECIGIGKAKLGRDQWPKFKIETLIRKYTLFFKHT